MHLITFGHGMTKMGDLIDLSNTPMAKLKADLQRKEEENAELVRQLTSVKSKIAGMVSVNEMLKMALLDLENTLRLYRDQLTGMITNLVTLRGKLPDINSRVNGVRTQDRDHDE